MNPFRHASLMLLIALGVALPATVLAANWQAYLTEANVVGEIDADSVRLSDGLVNYKYRKRFASGVADPVLSGLQGADARRAQASVADHVIDAVADCAGRRRADVTRGTLLLLPAREESWDAYQVDAACRLAGLTTTPGVKPDWQSASDGQFIDVNSLKVQDGLLFFDYMRGNHSHVGDRDSAVVECAERRRSGVIGDHYTLQRVVEGGPQARQAEAACSLAHLAMPPAPSPAPVDFGLAIAPEEAGDDNMRYDIVRPSIVVRDGLVHFQYTTRLLSDSSLAQEDQFVTAVVDCARRRRADEVGGVFDMRPVAPGTRGALQVARVCTIASMPAPTVAPAFAASVATVAAHEARACRYVRIGTVPVKWQGARLRVLGSINGVPVPMIVDTGASNVMIPNSLIDPLGLPVIEATKGDGYGGGGVSKVSAVRTSRMSIGDVRNVGQLMLVDLDSSNRDVLVGDDFLFEHDLEINDREMAFFSPQDCGDSSLAYWDRLTPYASLEFMDKSNPNPVVRVTINGKALRALVDTGATSSILDLAAARALGVDPRARGVAPFAAGAIGTHSLMVWPPEQFDTFEVGGEIIRHPRLAVADIFGNARRELSFSWLKLRNAPDLILGADFLRAHRLLFAQSQHRMYLSYTGGSVFDAPTVSDMPSPPGVPAAP